MQKSERANPSIHRKPNNLDKNTVNNMQFSKIIMTSLLGLALGSPVEKRTAAEIEADIATVSSDLTSFNTAINAFTGSLIQALSLLTSYNTLASAITAATAEVTDTGALTSAESATIYADVDSLTAQITDTLSDATAKVGPDLTGISIGVLRLWFSW